MYLPPLEPLPSQIVWMSAVYLQGTDHTIAGLSS